MEKIPVFPKIVLNCIFYILYVLIVSILFSFLFPQILLFLGKPIPESGDPLFYKVQIVIAVFIFVITIMFRKYVYLSLETDEKRGVSVRENKKNLINSGKEDISSKTQKNADNIQKNQKIEEQANGGIKIYIDKEIQ